MLRPDPIRYMFYMAGFGVMRALAPLERFMIGLGAGILSKLQHVQRRFALHRLVRLRQRYIFTRRGNRVRLRYMFSLVLIAALSVGVAALQGGSFGVSGFAGQRGVSGGLSAAQSAAVMPVAGMTDDDVRSKISEGMRQAVLSARKASRPEFQTIKIGSGDTVAGALQDVGVSSRDSYMAVKAMSTHFDPRRIKPGQKLGVYFEEMDGGAMQLSKMTVKIDPVREVIVARSDAAADEAFEANLIEKELEQISHARGAEIQTSLYGSAARAGIPPRVIAEVIRAYSWDVDFQRDIRQGDKIEVLYDTYATEEGEFAKYGDVLYANLSVGGKDMPIYRYEMKDGRVDYFQPDGHSIRKTLMKTPVDGARLSSGYGMRKHPVLGYNKMHKGMDFAASTGTPIYAAGDGVIEYVGRNGGYGNYIRLRHNGTLKTAYAHMHKFARGMVKGKRVEQGQVIGYVGTTGRSTGPHLHYEVLVHDQQTNPRSVDLPTGEQLAGTELANFKALIGAVDQQYAALSDGLRFAELHQ